MVKEGEKAPHFEGKDQYGNILKLSDFKGKKVILFFYPKDNTPSCTKEACNLRDNYEILKEKGMEVIGVSSDSEKSHQKFIKKYNLPYTLLADTDRKIMKSFGAYGEKKMWGRLFNGTHRYTFVIDEEGVVEKVIEKVKSKEHAQQILEALNKK